MLRGASGQIDVPSGPWSRPSVGDPDGHRDAILQIGHQDLGAKWQRPMRGCEVRRIKRLAIAREPTEMLATFSTAIIRRLALDRLWWRIGRFGNHRGMRASRKHQNHQKDEAFPHVLVTFSFAARGDGATKARLSLSLL